MIGYNSMGALSFLWKELQDKNFALVVCSAGMKGGGNQSKKYFFFRELELCQKKFI